MRKTRVEGWRCQACGGLITRINWPPHAITLDTAWVHINRWGGIKRRVKHPPLLSIQREGEPS